MDPKRAFEFSARLCKAVASSRKLQPLLDWVVGEVKELLGADEGAIKLRTIASSGGTVAMKRDWAGSWPPKVSVDVLHFLDVSHGPLATPDLLNDARLPEVDWPDGFVRSALAVPLEVEGRSIGMLAVSTRKPGRTWEAEEQQLLTIIATLTAEVIERFNKSEQLAAAARIQAGLLPSESLRCGPWQIKGMLDQAWEVGGDFFDYFKISEGRFAVVIVDVAGKGYPAAMQVRTLRERLRVHCDGRRSLDTAFREINAALLDGRSSKFATVFHAEIDHRRGVLRYVRAGHTLPLLLRADGTLEKLDHGDLPLGVFSNVEFVEHEIPFVDGDALLLYTDGITEALNEDAEEFGEARLEDLWKKLGHAQAGTAMNTIFDEVRHFRGSREQTDDIAMLVVSGDKNANRIERR